MIGFFYSNQVDWSAVLFSNIALIRSEYKRSEEPGVIGKQVEFVPAVNLKTGVRTGYRNFKLSFQLTYLSDQYTDATNAVDGGVSAVIAQIPAYNVSDVSTSYQF